MDLLCSDLVIMKTKNWWMAALQKKVKNMLAQKLKEEKGKQVELS